MAVIGYHPETGVDLTISDNDRYPGTYVLGVQGMGKSGLLQNLIAADMEAGHAMIVIDPHGDLIRDLINVIPPQRIWQTFVLDMEDEAYPFGVNLFSVVKPKTELERTERVERIMHLFKVLWPETVNQQYIPLYLPNAVQVFLDNPGTTLYDMLRFFQEDGYRAMLLRHVTDPSVVAFWRNEYDPLSKSERDQKVKALTNRLHTLFTGHSLVRNILGQQNTINFRKAIEEKQIILIKLPTTTIGHVARLIATVLIAQIQETVFSFGDIPATERPDTCLYIDEFQNFIGEDIKRLFTEGRKFGMRLTIAHQERGQLNESLQRATMTANNQICFRVTPDDARDMAKLFPSNEATVQPDDISEHPVHYLLTHMSSDPHIRLFTEFYLHPLQGRRRGQGRIEIEMRDSMPSFGDLWHGERAPNPKVTDPTWQLDSLLHQVMVERDWTLPIAPEIVVGFSNCGQRFYKEAVGLRAGDPILTADVQFPKHLVSETYQWTRTPESGTEQLYHFIFHLRVVMMQLAEAPPGKATTTSTTEVARMLTQLPRRAAFVRSANTVSVMYTHKTEPWQSKLELYERAMIVSEQTRQTYCHPKAEVEQWFMPAQPQMNVPAQTIQAEEIE